MKHFAPPPSLSERWDIDDERLKINTEDTLKLTRCNYLHFLYRQMEVGSKYWILDHFDKLLV